MFSSSQTLNVKRKKILQLVNDFGCLGSSDRCVGSHLGGGAPLVAMCGLCSLPWLSVLGVGVCRQLQLQFWYAACLVAPWHVKSSWTRFELDPYTGRWMLYHWTTGKPQRKKLWVSVYIVFKVIFIEIMLLCSIVSVSAV